MNKLDIRRFGHEEWSIKSAELIDDKISQILAEDGNCSVMLTGGRSASLLYAAWAEMFSLRNLTGVNFYFGDERCVPPDDSESNYGLVMRTLFAYGVPTGCNIYRIEAEDTNTEAAVRRYDELIPDSIDILILSIGEDGHVASLFPHSTALCELNQRVLHITGPKVPYHRLTITPLVIKMAKSIFVLATGEVKAKILNLACQNPNNFNMLPACLVLNATWLMDN